VSIINSINNYLLQKQQITQKDRETELLQKLLEAKQQQKGIVTPATPPAQQQQNARTLNASLGITTQQQGSARKPQVVLPQAKNAPQQQKPSVATNLYNGIRSYLKQAPINAISPLAQFVPGKYKEAITNGVGSFARNAAQGVPREMMSLALQERIAKQKVADTIKKKTGVSVPFLNQKSAPETQFTPKTGFEKFVLGNEKVAPAQQYGEEQIKSLPFGIGNKISDKSASRFAIPFVVGSVASNFLGGGEEKAGMKALEKGLVAAKDTETVSKLLSKAGFADDIVKEFLPTLAKTTKPTEVKQILSTIGEAQKAALKITPDLMNTEHAAQIWQEIDSATAGKRIMQKDGKFIAQKSSFPEWVSPGLKKSPLFGEVKQAMIDDTIPKSKPAQELYMEVKNEILSRSGVANDVAPTVKPIAQDTSKAIDPLMQEARKYKSAEEFVKAKTNAQHGTNASFTEFRKVDPSKGEAVYLSEKGQKKAGAISSRGGKLMDISIDESKVKTFDPRQSDNKEINGIVQEAIDKVHGKDRFRYDPSAPIERGNVINKVDDVLQSNVIRIASKKGYNDFRFYEPSTREYSRAITDSSILKTKSQLTDIYNQATKGAEQAVPKAPDALNVIDKIPKKAGEEIYNIRRMGSTPEGKKVIDKTINEVRPAIQEIVGKTLTNDEIIQRAQYASDDLIKTIGRKSTADLAAAQLRLRQNIAKMADEGAITKDFIESLKTDKSFRTDAGRQLQKLSVVAEPRTAQGKLKELYITNILKVNDDLDAIEKAAKDINWNDQKQTTEFYRSFIKPKMADWIDKIRYNSMLSSPTTHIVNISSNLQGTLPVAAMQKTIEGGVDLLHSAITGKPRTRFAGEGAAYVKGYTKSLHSAFTNLADALKGKTNALNPDVRSIPLSTGGISKVAETFLDLPARALSGMDQFFKTLTQGSLESSYAYRLKKGAAGLAPSASKEAEKMLFLGKLSDKSEGVLSHGLGAFAKKLSGFRKSDSFIVRWMAKMSLPFISTGTNIAKFGIESNPVLGAINLIKNEDKTAAVAKMIMGGAVTLTGASLAFADRMTAYAPASGKAKDQFYASGRQPWSIKVGDKWVSYSKLHPLIGFQLGMTAAVAQTIKDGKIDDTTGEKIMNGVAQSIRFFADQSYFKNVGDFSNFITGDKTALKKLVSNYPSQFIPFRTTMSWVNRIMDKYQREPDTNADFVTQVYQNIASQLPGLSQTVPQRMGSNGTPLENDNRILNAFSPSKVTNVNPYEEGKFQDTLVKAKKADQIKVKSDELIKNIMDDIKKTPIWTQANPAEKEKILNRVTDKVRAKVTTSISPESDLLKEVKKRLKARGLDSTQAEEVGQRIVNDMQANGITEIPK